MDILDKAKKGDFVFVDPPYDGKTFKQYGQEMFESKNQVELSNKLKELDKKGVRWILCNFPTENIKELYKDFKYKEFPAIRSISSKSETRKGTSKEVFYYNYALPNKGGEDSEN